jgi:tyrosyl-tRNA synthetase
MSKSYGNAVAFRAEPNDMFGKIMSVEDGVMRDWFVQLTRLPDAEIDALLAGHPREAKARLAQEITAHFHGAQLARGARDAFDRQFRDKEVPADVPDAAFPDAAPAEGLPLMVLLRDLGMTTSTSDAKRLIEGGGVKLDGAVEKDPRRMMTRPGSALLIQAGKRKYVRVQP